MGDTSGGMGVLAFDTTQITNPDNRSKPQPGAPCHTLAGAPHPPAICVTGEQTHALTSEGHDAGEDGTGRGTPIICMASGQANAEIVSDGEPSLTCLHEAPIVAGTISGHTGGGYRNDLDTSGAYPVQAGVPRRLTPRECERLQGWPDDWTLVPFRGKPMSDSARYRMIGNGVASPVAHWIGLRLRAALECQCEECTT